LKSISCEIGVIKVMALYFYQLRSNVLNTFLLHLHCDLRWWSSTMYLYFIHWSIELLIGLLVVGVYLEIAMPRIMLHSIIIVYSSHHSLNNRFINTIIKHFVVKWCIIIKCLCVIIIHKLCWILFNYSAFYDDVVLSISSTGV